MVDLWVSLASTEPSVTQSQRTQQAVLCYPMTSLRWYRLSICLYICSTYNLFIKCMIRITLTFLRLDNLATSKLN